METKDNEENLGTVVYTYDATARKVTVNDKRGLNSEHEYDLLRRPTKITRPAPGTGSSHGQPITNYTYNRTGRSMTVSDPAGLATITTHDVMGRPITVQLEPSGGSAVTVASYTYELDGKLKSETDRHGNTTSYNYDRLSHTVTETVPNLDGQRTDKKVYDWAGRLKSYKVGDNLANSQLTTYEHDSMGRKTTVTHPSVPSLGSSLTTTFTYGDYGQLEETKDRNGNTIAYAYDLQGRQISESWKDVSGQLTGDAYERTYFPAGNPKSVSYAAAAGYVTSIAVEYDILGRAKSVLNEDSERNAVELSYSYDLNGNRTYLGVSAADASGTNFLPLFSNTYSLDNLDRVYHISQAPAIVSGTSTNITVPKAIDFQYLIDGLISTTSRYEYVTTSGTNSPVTYTHFQYSGLKENTGIQHHSGTANGSLLYTQTNNWTDSELTQIAKSTSGATTVTTTYDHYADQQLKSETTESSGNTLFAKNHFWDAFGNPLDDPTLVGPSAFYVEGDNRLRSDYEFEYEYDNNGSLIKKIARSGGDYEEYAWNHRGKMTEARAFNATGVLQWSEEYRYDGANRSVMTIHTEYQNGQPGTAEEKFSVYDGFDLYSLIMEMDDAEQVTSTYLHGAAVDMVLAEDNVVYDAAGAIVDHDIHWPLADHQNTLQASARSDGNGNATVDGEFLRDAFGKEISSSGNVEPQHGYQGHQNNPNTGHDVFRNRNYSAQQGRFISQDPLGFAAGDVNHYRFVGNRPTVGTDPSGLAGYFFDGTNNSAADRQTFTNVYRLYIAYGDSKFYANGIGSGYEANHVQSSGWPDMYEQMTGKSMEEPVSWMMGKLEEQLADGDNVVDLFGFSRGSASAVRFLHAIDERMQSGDALFQDIEIRFVALFDSVPSKAGVIKQAIRSYGDTFVTLHTAKLIEPNHYARHASDAEFTLPEGLAFTHRPLHLISLDEQRKEFAVTNLSRALQVGFKGVHSDVGGGYGGNFFEFITREFVVEESRRRGLSLWDEPELRRFDNSYRDIYEMYSDPTVRPDLPLLEMRASANAHWLKYNDGEPRRFSLDMQIHESVHWFREKPKNDIQWYFNLTR